VSKFFGGLLMAIGIIIAALTGLCSAYFLVMFAFSAFQTEGLFMIGIVLLVGGLPCLGGVGLFLWGRSLVRGARERGE